MTHVTRVLLSLLLLLGAVPAWSALSCNISSNPAQLKLVYTSFQVAQLQGTLNVTCTRDPNNDPRKPDLWIGFTQATTGRTATLDTGGSTLNYTVAHRGFNSGIWTSIGGVQANSSTNDAVLDTSPDFGNRGSSITESYDVYLQVPFLQFRPAGVYLDSIPITLRLSNQSGTILDTGTLDVFISIPRSCRFSTPPTAISINYIAFAAAPVLGTSNFALTCTQGTTYTIALDRTRSVVPTVELAYSLSLSAGSATGNAVAQGYTVNVSVDPKQAGRCNGATCTGTDVRTLTVTY